MSAIAELKVFSSSQISQSAVVPASVGSKPQFDCLIAHHYALVALTPDGAKIRGWDFKQLETATAFAERVRPDYSRIEIWSRDELANVLARIVPENSNGRWRRISCDKAACRRSNSRRVSPISAPRATVRSASCDLLEAM